MSFHDKIKTALLDIDDKYFKQKTIDLKRFKYNERVFCYELYHQLRKRESEFSNLTISGEAVKSEFQFKNLGKNKTPDLLIHNFGTIDNNEVVIEVKTTKNLESVVQGLKKDFITLDLFTDNTTVNIDYKLGIYILINHDFWTILNANNKISKYVKKIISRNKRIVVWNISKPAFSDNGKLIIDCLKVYTNEELRTKISS